MSRERDRNLEIVDFDPPVERGSERFSVTRVIRGILNLIVPKETPQFTTEDIYNSFKR